MDGVGHMSRVFDNPAIQEAYDYYMTLSVDALAVLAIRLRKHNGDFENGTTDMD